MDAVEFTAMPRIAAPPVQRRMGHAEAAWAYALCSPALVLMIAIYILPIATVTVLSFTDYEFGAPNWSWVGDAHFRALLADPVFWRALRNTFTYAAIIVPVAVGLGLLVALLIQRRGRLRSVYQVIFYLPVTTTLVAMATVWHFVLHPQLGPVNAALDALGLGRIDVFSDPDLVLAGLAVIGAWQLVGFNMILFLAGLTAIPQDLYDAAAVEGADHPIDRFLRVTWPLLGPTTMFVVITTCITAFKVFDTVVVLTRGGPLGRSEVLLYAMYLEGFQYFRIGYASALTLVFLALIVAASAIQAFLIDRKVHYG